MSNEAPPAVSMLLTVATDPTSCHSVEAHRFRRRCGSGVISHASRGSVSDRGDQRRCDSVRCKTKLQPILSVVRLAQHPGRPILSRIVSFRNESLFDPACKASSSSPTQTAGEAGNSIRGSEM